MVRSVTSQWFAQSPHSGSLSHLTVVRFKMELFEDDLEWAKTVYGLQYELKEEQIDCLKHIYSGHDTIAHLPTGFGKSLCYHLLPFLLTKREQRLDDGNKKVVIVLSPLNVIQEDQMVVLKSHNISTCRIDSSGSVRIPCSDTIQRMDSVEGGEYDIIHYHPEALFSSSDEEALVDSTSFRSLVGCVVIDECHKVEDWSKGFRRDFGKIPTLRTYFAAPMLALSGTLTKQAIASIPGLLSLSNFKIVSANPDRPNIFIEKKVKERGFTVTDTYENIYTTEADAMLSAPLLYPPTLMYMPLERASEAMAYLMSQEILPLKDTKYGVLFSKQDKEVIKHITCELQKKNPSVRLVLCTPCVGMGFDSPSITNVIHTRPPRNLSDYFQEIGRCGRTGQQSKATMFYELSDISTNLPGMSADMIDFCKCESECLREKLLQNFGYNRTDESPTGCKCCSVCVKTCKCVDCVTGAGSVEVPMSELTVNDLF